MIPQRKIFVNVEQSISYYLQILIDFWKQYRYTNKYEKIIIACHGCASLPVCDLM